MTERERLIELLEHNRENPFETCPQYGTDDYCVGCKYDELDDCSTHRLADYLLANGVRCPPCKVGDTLYDIHNEKVFGGKVIMVNMFEDCFTFAASGGRYFKDDEIGKTVFLTKEAEQALKGGGEG